MTDVTVPRIRLILADDEPILLEAITELAELEPRVEIVGVATNADEAIELATRLLPDVALVDVRMPGGGGRAAAAGIAIQSPKTRTLAFSAYDDRGSVREMLAAGAVGYVVKGTTENPITAVLRAAAGEEYAEAAEPLA